MYTIIWLVLLVLFLIVEASTVTMLSLWFAGGALVALAASLLHWPLWLQITLFLAVSAALLAALRPMAKKHFTPKLAKTNVDAVIGTQGYVTAPIDNMTATGTVKLGSMEWTARSADGTPIAVGTLVRANRVEGVKVFVTPVKIPENV